MRKIEPREYVFKNEQSRKRYLKKELRELEDKESKNYIDQITIECLKQELGI